MLGVLLSRFSSGNTDIHVSLKAEKVFEVGGFAITNSIFYGFIVAAFTAFVIISLARRSKVKPQKGPVAFLEVLVEFIVDLLETTFGSRKKAIKYTPYFAVYFIFIIFSNGLELLPIVGEGIKYNGVPMLRPFTADLNGTIVMAVTAIVMVQVLSIKEQGVKGHLTHYFSDKPMNPINFFIGLLEVFGEFTRIMSLSLRLFLNTAVGEILITVFTSLILTEGRTPLAVIPIFLFEILVAGIQAYVFTILAATYLSLAISHTHDDDEHDETVIHKVEELQPS